MAEGITTLEDHERALVDPDGYRPHRCPTCLHERMHAHDFRFRKPRGDLDEPPEIMVRRFVCASRCGAIWLVLPGFLARHLWRVWTTVGVILGSGERRRVVVPERTQTRWHERLRTAGRKLVSVLATAGGEELAKVAGALGAEASRGEVVGALGGPGALAAIAGLVHRLAAGVRVM